MARPRSCGRGAGPGCPPRSTQARTGAASVPGTNFTPGTGFLAISACSCAALAGVKEGGRAGALLHVAFIERKKGRARASAKFSHARKPLDGRTALAHGSAVNAGGEGALLL